MFLNISTSKDGFLIRGVTDALFKEAGRLHTAGMYYGQLEAVIFHSLRSSKIMACD